MGCVGCHQLGQLATRTLPPSLGKFASSHDAWLRRISSGQAGAGHGAHRGRAARRRAAEVPRPTGPTAWRRASCRPPSRSGPQGIERNVVATRARLGEREELSARPLRHRPPQPHGERLRPAVSVRRSSAPTICRYSIRRRHVATTFHAPVRDADTPTHPATIPSRSPRPTGATSSLWDSKANIHNPMFDAQGPRVVHRAHPRRRQSRVLQDGLRASLGQGVSARTLRPAARDATIRRRRSTRSSTPASARTTCSSRATPTTRCGPAAAGRSSAGSTRRSSLATGDAAASQGWSPFVLDTNGNGKRDELGRARPAARIRSKDTRLPGSFYAVMPNPTDGSIWGSAAFGFPGCASIRFDPQDAAQRDLHRAAARASACAARDIDSNGVVWVVARQRTSGRVRSQQVQGAAERPDGDRRSCPEGWTFHQLPGPGLRGSSAQDSVESQLLHLGGPARHAGPRPQRADRPRATCSTACIALVRRHRWSRCAFPIRSAST